MERKTGVVITRRSWGLSARAGLHVRVGVKAVIPVRFQSCSTFEPVAEHALIDAFPPSARQDAEIALRSLRAAERAARFPDRPVTFGGQPVWIPSRLYNPEPSPLVLEGLTPQRRIVLHCLLSRHHDGHVRERHVAALLTSHARFVVPFGAQASSDYVIEILQLIQRSLPALTQRHSAEFLAYGQFFYENPEALEALRQRTESFWRAHHAEMSRDDYPGFRLLTAFQRAAAHQANTAGPP